MTDTEQNGAAVEARGLVRTFGAERAVDGLDLSVRRGECLGLLGPNGAGKTTTLRILATLTAPTEGSVRVLGLDPMRDGADLRQRLGVVPQEVALYDTLSARENLEFFASLYGLSGAKAEERVAWGLATAELQERADSRVGTFSGGMKRRLNIVAALLHEPELVFLDEPTVGIDPQSRNHIFEMVDALRAGGTTMIYTTHQLGEVERVCDRIVVMDAGRAVAAGTLEELQRAAMEGEDRGSGLSFEATVDLAEAQRVLAAGGIACSLREDVPDLEEVFLSLTGKALRDDE